MYGLIDFKISCYVLQVARLLMDTSVLQFYPTLFVLAAEIMDMLGNLVWERIKQKAEFGEDGSRLCYLSGPYPLSFCVFSLYLSLTLSFSHFHSLSLCLLSFCFSLCTALFKLSIVDKFRYILY